MISINVIILELSFSKLLEMTVSKNHDCQCLEFVEREGHNTETYFGGPKTIGANDHFENSMENNMVESK